MYTHTTSFFIYPSVNGHLGGFHVLAVGNSAAMNIGVHVYPFGSCFSPGICPGTLLFLSTPRTSVLEMTLHSFQFMFLDGDVIPLPCFITSGEKTQTRSSWFILRYAHLNYIVASSGMGMWPKQSQ